MARVSPKAVNGNSKEQRSAIQIIGPRPSIYMAYIYMRQIPQSQEGFDICFAEKIMIRLSYLY